MLFERQIIWEPAMLFPLFADQARQPHRIDFFSLIDQTSKVLLGEMLQLSINFVDLLAQAPKPSLLVSDLLSYEPHID